MSIQNRPYVGTWVANRRNIVQWTPDFLVYLNGDTSLPGCNVCHHNININEFINSISVDFSVEPGASNCSVDMAIPRHYGDSVFRDGNTLLRPGLEIHVYFRGYFPMKGLPSPDSQPVAGINLSDIPQYPYYPVFHGVVTGVTQTYSGGFYTVNMTCNGMLHFWESQKLSGAQGGSFFGARPDNSGIRTTLTGHPMSGKTPYAIIYSLYRDTAGVADGVGFALSSRTNYRAVNSTSNDPLYALTLRYWEERFRNGIYGLRMHGASGQLFTSSQQAYLSMYGVNSYGGSSGTANVSGSAATPNDDIWARDPALLLGLRVRNGDGRVLRQADTRLLVSGTGQDNIGLDVSNLQAFPTDIGSYGQVNLWESTYETKMSVAGAVTDVSGYEFFQDCDGDLVFKPPLYNLDTSSSRVYRIEPEDVISLTLTENEPQATFCTIKGGALSNIQGLMDESQFGMRSTYIDYKLVSQFGWKETSVESHYYTNAQAAFWFAVNHLDRTNAGTNSGTVVIPLRPEIRVGYPVYIVHIDCFYYVTSVAHSFSLGSDCTTTLTLTARRRKFLAPASDAAARNGPSASDSQLSQVDLSKTANPVIPLQTLDNGGVPRLIGFPNVVMAIDPTTINPLFSVTGYQAIERELSTGAHGDSTAQDNSRREVFLWQFIRQLLTRRPAILRLADQVDNAPNVPPPSGDVLAENPNQNYVVAGLPGNTSTGVTVSVTDIRNALETYRVTRSRVREARSELQRQLIAQQQILNGRNSTDQAKEQARTRYGQIQGLVEQLNANLDFVSPQSANDVVRAYYRSYNTLARVVGEVTPGRQRDRLQSVEVNTRLSAETDAGKYILMSYLIGQFRVPQGSSGDIQTDPSGTINQSANLLQHLSDRKASLNLTVPGYYRYYSASHPNPAQQGYLPVSREYLQGGEDSTLSSVPTGATVNNQGRVVGSTSREVAYQETHLTGEQAAAYIIRAWRTLHHGQSPPSGVAEVLVSQWALETGRGRRMINYNFGGIKAVRGGLRTRYGTTEGAVSTGNFRRARLWFQAYGSPEEGALHFVRILSAGMHREALAQYINALGQGQSRTVAADRYVRQLRSTNYFTGDVEDYSRNVQGLVTGSASRWVQNASTSGTPLGPTVDPAERPNDPPQTVRIPETELSTNVVQQATDTSGIPEDRRGEYVTVTPGFTPTNGLKVRVITDSSTRVIPTNLIYSMTFETRGSQVLTSSPVVAFNPEQPRQFSDFINACLSQGGPQQFRDSLANGFFRQIGAGGQNSTRPDAASIQAAIALAVEDIEGLSSPRGLIPTPADLSNVDRADISRQTAALLGQAAFIPVLNIAGGRPNDYNPLPFAPIRANAPAGILRVLKAKAAALIREVTKCNEPELREVQTRLEALGRGRIQTIPPDVLRLIEPWETCLKKLFRTPTLPQSGPFRNQNQMHLVETNFDDISPVFPVSDAQGYEHYGSYQYGRGLSIEPGGNYERLMATDPFQYLSDEARERFLQALHGSADGRAARVARVIRELANDENFRHSPGAQIAIDYARRAGQNSSDRTAMIAFGMRNYIMSDRDAVMKMPVNNAAYQLSDLTPLGQQDTCACRGAESDLLLAAYMAGTQGFTQIVQTQDEATDWVQGQMLQAAASWSQAQSRMRGMNLDQGRRSLLDSVEGWQSIVNNFRETNTSLANNLVGGTKAGIERVETTAQQVVDNARRTVPYTDPTPTVQPAPTPTRTTTAPAVTLNAVVPPITPPTRTGIARTVTTPTVPTVIPSQRNAPTPPVVQPPIGPPVPPRRQ